MFSRTQDSKELHKPEEQYNLYLEGKNKTGEKGQCREKKIGGGRPNHLMKGRVTHSVMKRVVGLHSFSKSALSHTHKHSHTHTHTFASADPVSGLNQNKDFFWSLQLA